MRGKPRVGISRCLLGERVRYDGAHAVDPYLRHTLGRFVEWVPICPEVESGFPVPREPMRLRGEPADPRLIVSSTGQDRTEGMRRWTEKKLRELEGEGLCGFVFKAASPSCGIHGVKVYGLKGAPPRRGSGVFARAFSRRFSLLPVIDEEGMCNPTARESFIERVFVYARWWDLLSHGATLQGLMDFNASVELLVSAHDAKAAASMARLIARAGSLGRQKLFERYGASLMGTLDREATVSKNARVLKTMYERLKGLLSDKEAAPLRAVIEDFRGGHVPLLVPLVLIRHYVQRFADPYLSRQLYLDPYPAELGLRARG